MKGETIWMFLDVSGNYEIEDSRYYEDDVTRLVSLSLLRVTYNARGETIYNLTRAAGEYAQRLLRERAGA
tara:strand:+ start:640 stop:849 length:210 start_codon:yes stop_codon:yes gene_type:complete